MCKLNKYINYNYNDEIKKMIETVILNKSDKLKMEEYMNNSELQNKVYFPIIKELYILANKYNLSCSYLADEYNVSTRTIQMWLKDLNLNRNKKDNKVIRNNDLNKTYKEKIYNQSCNNEIERYALYRFLDKERKVLYIGKCLKVNKTLESNEVYFIRQRLQQHFSPSSKQLPKSLYLNTKYIEVFYPNVNSNEELELIECSLISYYERYKMECYYNKDISFTISDNLNFKEDNFKWTSYHIISTKERNNLKKKYNFTKIPNIEIINERLKAIIWFKETKNTTSHKRNKIV